MLQLCTSQQYPLCWARKYQRPAYLISVPTDNILYFKEAKKKKKEQRGKKTGPQDIFLVILLSSSHLHLKLTIFCSPQTFYLIFMSYSFWLIHQTKMDNWKIKYPVFLCVKTIGIFAIQTRNCLKLPLPIHLCGWPLAKRVSYLTTSYKKWKRTGEKEKRDIFPIQGLSFILLMSLFFFRFLDQNIPYTLHSSGNSELQGFYFFFPLSFFFKMSSHWCRRSF